MAKWIVRVGRVGNSYRVVLPVAFIKSVGWEDLRYLVVDDNAVGDVVLKALDFPPLVGDGFRSDIDANNERKNEPGGSSERSRKIFDKS
jgi:hypothetical protein